jgi:hypothetical protein
VGKQNQKIKKPKKNLVVARARQLYSAQIKNQEFAKKNNNNFLFSPVFV